MTRPTEKKVWDIGHWQEGCQSSCQVITDGICVGQASLELVLDY